MKKQKTKTFISILLAVIFSLTVFSVAPMAAETTAAEETSLEETTTAEETIPEKTTAEETTAAPIPVTGITLDKTAAVIQAGKSLVLKASVTPEDADNKKIKWTSSNKDVATVSKKGKVSAKAYGTATITAATKDGGFVASCEIKVLFFDLGDASEDFYEPIYWAVDQKVVDPETKTMFLPKSTCTREEVITYLYNLMEKPEYKAGTTFKDVKKGSTCYDAVSWAEENGLLKDIATGKKFAGGKSCLKEELATFLYRLKGAPYVGYDGLFVDVKDDSYFKDAVNWSVENNITDGYREPDGSSSYIYGCGDKQTKEDVVITLYNYTHAKNPAFAEEFYAAYRFPVLTNGMEVSDEIYAKYSNPQYCAEVFAYYALQDGWQYEAVVGALAFMWAEGLSANGTFTYEGCWTVTGPSGAIYDKTLDNAKWREWVHSADCRAQMISHSPYYSNYHYATGLGYCGESNAWNFNGGKWTQTLYNCDTYLTAADIAGVAWQDINFQTQRAMFTILSTSYDPDFRDPTTYTGDAREYCARVFATVGAGGFTVWYDNGMLGAHLAQVEVVRPLVDAVINHTSLLEEDLAKQ